MSSQLSEMTSPSPSGSSVQFVVRLLLLGASVLVLCLSLSFPGKEISAVAIALALIVSIYGALVCRRCWILVIPFVFLAYCLYSILCAVYLGTVEESPYLIFARTDYAWTGASVMLAFTIGITLFLPLKVRRFPDVKMTSPCFKGVIVAVCVIGIVLAAFNLDEMSGSRMKIGSFYEYSVIFVIVGFYYASDNKWAIVAIVLSVAFRTALDFFTGNRVTSLEMLTALLVMGVLYRMKGTRLVAGGILLYLALMTVGSLRGSGFSLEAVADTLVNTVLPSYGVWDGAYSAYHTSMCILATEQLYSPLERVAQFPGFLLSLSLSPVDLVSDPTALAGQAFWHMGGTYYPFFFHFYLGLPGVIVASCALGLLLRWLAKLEPGTEKLPVLGLVVVWVAATCFRWIQYEPTHLARGILLMSVVAFIAYLYASGTDRGQGRAKVISANQSKRRAISNPRKILHDIKG